MFLLNLLVKIYRKVFINQLFVILKILYALFVWNLGYRLHIHLKETIALPSFSLFNLPKKKKTTFLNKFCVENFVAKVIFDNWKFTMF